MRSNNVKYCPICGSKLIIAERVGRDRPVCPSCDWVFFPDPKVAVVVVIINNRKVLLTRRVNTPQQGKWTFPGGFVDAGEDPARAAERECLEETGLVVEVSGLVDVLSGKEHPRGADILIIYNGEIRSGVVQPGDDADLADFFSLDDLPPLAFYSTQEIIERISEIP
ncbi:MAG: NUDIX domain-containing protein [Anaerolineales bacterium]|jgi:ADP-ribose pyrophosphatase YjhB (NUDIX family)